MIYQLLLVVYVINSLLLVFLILLQKGKSSMGMGAIGGSSQAIFGGSGGQDIFQKATWVLGAIFMIGSLVLSIMRSAESKKFTYVTKPGIVKQVPVETKK